MAFLWGRSKDRSDLVRAGKQHLSRALQKAQGGEEDLAKTLGRIKLTLQGTQEVESNPEVVAQIINSLIQDDLLDQLSKNIHSLPFESRKDTQTIFSYAVRYRPPGSSSSQAPPVISYIVYQRPEIITQLCRGYEHKESAMPCGAILREALKFEDVIYIILYDEPGVKFRLDDVNERARASGHGVFWWFFPWIDRGAFEISTDAFTTFRDILTRHKQAVAQFISVNFEAFFGWYNSTLVGSQSYVTKRQSIKLLGEILLDRANYDVMMAYVDSGENLKIFMNLLKDDRKMVQYEGFHVFKVFVANPHKSVPVQKILINNREKLLKFLPAFLADRTEDDQFIDEKSFLVRQIELLPPTPVEPSRP